MSADSDNAVYHSECAERYNSVGPARTMFEESFLGPALLSLRMKVTLTLWFVISLLSLPGLDYETVRTWLGYPLTGFLAVLLIAVLSYHSHLGTTVIVEDYVHIGGMKVLALMLLRFLHVLVGGAAIFAILRVVFGFGRL